MGSSPSAVKSITEISAQPAQEAKAPAESDFDNSEVILPRSLEPEPKDFYFEKYHTFRLGVIKDSSAGTGDWIWLASAKKKDRIDSKAIAVLAGYDYGSGLININGRDIEIKSVEQNSPEENLKVGRGGYGIWEGKNITVRLDYVFTWLCPPEDESCEVYEYKGLLDINYKGKQRKVNIVAFGGT